MTLLELSSDYHAQAQALRTRISALEAARAAAPETSHLLEGRIHTLRVMWREASELAVLTRRYYERGYHRSGKYTL